MLSCSYLVKIPIQRANYFELWFLTGCGPCKFKFIQMVIKVNLAHVKPCERGSFSGIYGHLVFKLSKICVHLNKGSTRPPDKSVYLTNKFNENLRVLKEPSQ